MPTNYHVEYSRHTCNDVITWTCTTCQWQIRAYEEKNDFIGQWTLIIPYKGYKIIIRGFFLARSSAKNEENMEQQWNKSWWRREPCPSCNSPCQFTGTSIHPFVYVFFFFTQHILLTVMMMLGATNPSCRWVRDGSETVPPNLTKCNWLTPDDCCLRRNEK